MEPALGDGCANLQALLTQLRTRVGASSISLFDPQGLLFSEGQDAQGLGARLCTLLSVQDQLPQDRAEFAKARSFELGTLRFQQLPEALGAQAWLATVGAKRPVSAQELSCVEQFLAREL